MKAAELFLRCLEAQGVTTIYGVPGEENADLMIALLDSSIEFVVCRHEQEAAFMADMQGRITGKPGVCMATLGPGATNLLTGVANANMDHAPLVAIIGQASTNRLHKESHQNMDAVSMYKPVTDWATTIRDAEVIPEVVEKAFKRAISSKPSAVLIELPEDIAGLDIDDIEPLKPANVDYEKGVESYQVNRALQLISDSRAPLILLGAGCMRARCDGVIEEFIAKTNIFAANTFVGKGTISARNSQTLFCVGLGMRDIAMEAFDKADLVICIGYDMVEWHPDRWNPEANKTIIHIDSAPAEVDRAYMPQVELVGEICGIISKLNESLDESHQKDPDLFRETHKKVHQEIIADENDCSFPMKPQRILCDLRRALGDEDILISDVGAHKMWVARQYPTYKSGSCIIYNGFCSMGGSMPGAFVAKRLHPDKKVVAVVGDGGFIMSIQALVTAVRYKVPMVVVVWQDDQYGLIKWKQEAHFQKHSHIDLVNPDLHKLADAFGCYSQAVSGVDDFSAALTRAFAEKHRPSVIIVPVDYRENMKLTQRLGDIVSH